MKREVVIVTGAARGIGRTIAEAFVADSAVVVALDVESAELAALGNDLESAGAGMAVVCDVRDSARVRNVVDEVVARFARIDVLVNNAGINAVGAVDELDEDLWDRCFDVNVGGVFRVTKAVIPVMKRQESGRIINAASFAAIVPSVGQSAYAATKAAVVQFTRTVAGELGPWGITANSYAPGMIPTSINGFSDLPQPEQDELLNTLTLRRWGQAEEVAEVVRFLASDAARYITGALIDVSGGKLATQIPQRAYDRRAAGDAVRERDTPQHGTARTTPRA